MTRWTCSILMALLFAALASAQEAPPTPTPRAPAIAIISPSISVAGPGVPESPAMLKSPLAEALAKTGEKFTSITDSAASGKLTLGVANVLIVGSGALSAQDGRIAKTLWENRKVVADFVESGGVLVVLTSPADAGALAFLPGVTPAGIEPLSHGRRFMRSPDHPLVAGRHRLSPRDLGTRPGVLYPGGCYGVYLGLAPVVAMDERGRYPIILEGQAGKGRVLLMQLAPDRAELLGADDEKVGATLLMENLVDWLRKAVADEVPAPAPIERAVTGTVFEDVDGNGLREPGEPPLPGIEVSDGSALVRTDAQGRFRLPLDAYSEFVWVAADLAMHRGPFWRRIPADGSAVDIGLARRAKPIGAAARLIHLVDVGGASGASGKDPDMALVLGEIAGANPPGDLFVVAGDAGSANAPSPGAGPLGSALRVFVAYENAADPVAERDAFAKAFGPTAYLARVNGMEIAVTSPGLLEGRLPPSLASAVGVTRANRVEFQGDAWRAGLQAGMTTSFRRRGLDGPPGFRVIDWKPGGEFRTETRIAGLRGLFQCIYPAPESTVAPGFLRPVLALGDAGIGSDFPVKIEMAHIDRRGDRLDIVELAPGEYTLVPRGRLTRGVEFKKPLRLAPGYYVMRISAVSPDGKPWTRNMTFSVPAEPPPAFSFGLPWPMTGADGARTGESKEMTAPPFYLSGLTNVGRPAAGESPSVLSDVLYVRGAGRGSVAPPPFGGLQLPAKRLDFPFLCEGQGRYELHDDHVELASGPLLRYDFGRPAPDAQRSHLVGAGELLCVVDESGSAWAFIRSRGAEVKEGQYDAKAASASLKWRVDALPGCRRAVATNSELFTGAECIELGSGHVRWSWEKYALRDRSVAISGKYVVMTGVTREEKGPAPSLRQLVVCLEADTGRIVWEKTLAAVDPADDVHTPAPSVVKGTVYVGSADGVFYALRLAESSPGGPAAGSEVWSFKTGPSVLPFAPGAVPTGRICTQAAVNDQWVYFGACDGKVYALDRRKGEVEWSYNVGLPLTVSCALTGNSLFVGDWDGNVYCFTSVPVKKGKRP